MQQLSVVLADAVEIIADHPGERAAPDDLDCAGFLAGLQIHDADSVQAVVPGDEILAVGGDRVRTVTRVDSGHVGERDFLRLEQVAGVGTDGEIGVAPRATRTPDFCRENCWIAG